MFSSPGSWQSLLGPGRLNGPQDRHWSLYLDSLCQCLLPPKKRSLSSLLARSETSKRSSEVARLTFAQETDFLAILVFLCLGTSKLGGSVSEGFPPLCEPGGPMDPDCRLPTCPPSTCFLHSFECEGPSAELPLLALKGACIEGCFMVCQEVLLHGVSGGRDKRLQHNPCVHFEGNKVEPRWWPVSPGSTANWRDTDRVSSQVAQFALRVQASVFSRDLCHY